MVRTLPPVANGTSGSDLLFLPRTKNWPSYESIQAEIMEHFVSVLPAFELYPFQNADARDMILSSYIESAKVDLSTLIGIPWHTTVTQSNPFECRKTGGARLISESITDSGFHPLPTRQYRDKRTSGTGIGSPRLQQPDGPAPDRLGPNEKHPAGIGRVFLVTRRATSAKKENVFSALVQQFPVPVFPYPNADRHSETPPCRLFTNAVRQNRLV